MEDKITAILKDEFLSADIADQDLNANLGNVVKIVEKDYNSINNKPQINSVTLQGNKSALELGLVPTDLSKLEAVEQPTKSVRQTADMFVDNGGKPSKIALQQVKGMATKVVYANELGNVDFEKLDIDDYVILGDKIYRVVDAENNIKQLLPETSAEHVTFADKKGEYTSTNVEGALTEIAETVAENNEKLTSEIRGVGTLLTNHKNDKDNPHGVTKTQVGLGNVDNTTDLDKPISNAQKTVNAGFENNFKQLDSDIDTLGKGLNKRIDATNSNLTALRESTESALSNQQESINDIDSTLNSHIANQSNPHNVTKAQVGLDKVDNTADNEKTVKEAGKVTQKLRFMGALDGGGLAAVSYDGSKDTSVTLNGDDFLMGNESSVGSQSVSYELKKTGVTAGAYNGITVDGKGRVTAAEDKGYATKQELQEAVAGKVKTFTYDDYQKFVEATDAIARTGMGVGDNVYIKTLEVPDMWVTRVNAVSTLYTYTSDQAIVDALNSQYGLTVGYFTFSQLETTKVDLTDYQQTTDRGLNTTNKTVVGAINEVKGTADNALSKANANATEILQIKDGTTKVGNAVHSDSASKVANNLIFSGQNAQGTESTIGFNGAQAQEVVFNGYDFVATKGNAFEVSIARSGATAGTYNNVTVDEKGRVTAGKNIDYATMAQVNEKYTKPESGIPKSDLASSVQTSLDKADTALQSAPVTSVNGKTGAVTGLATTDEVNKKQNTLTDEQLAAVNSGITEAKRAKYDGYEATINQKANSADLAQVATSGSYSDLKNIPTDIAKIGNLSNPNLLINPNFAINQRGQASYTGAGYGVDRWKGIGTKITATPVANGIQLSSSGTSNIYIKQIVEENLAGKTVTASCKLSAINGGEGGRLAVYYSTDGTSWTLINGMTIATVGISKLTATIPANAVYVSVDIGVRPSSDVVFEWAKLEIGSVATEFSPPDNATELLKCQRYYIDIGRNDSTTYLIGSGVFFSATLAYVAIPIPTTLRTAPTLILGDLSRLTLLGDNKSYTPTGITLLGTNNNAVTLRYNVTGATAGNGCAARLLDTTNNIGILSLDAEI